MFSSFFSTSAPVDPTAPTFHPISSTVGPDDLFGELEAKDNEWLAQGSGFVTETQIFYFFLEDGTACMCQVIHASVGVWYPNVQFTCSIFNPNTKEKTWKSVNVTNFTTAVPGLDKRSCKSDQFTIKHNAAPGGDFAEGYTLSANLADDLQISLDVKRPTSASGFKVGRGEKGGYSYFGPDTAKPDGYVIHRFWPRVLVSGHVIRSGQALAITDGQGMFVHAIQGMRPNLIASHWNFTHFQSSELGGTSAIQMEYTTQKEYGPKGTGSGGVVVNLGGLVIGGKLAAVTAETRLPGEAPAEKADVMSRTEHVKPVHDADTNYQPPTGFSVIWSAPSLVKDAPGAVSAVIAVDLGGPSRDTAKGLIDKVDVLAEIPYVVKTVIGAVANTRPYIYQWVNPTTLTLTGPESLLPGGSAQVKGTVYTEATFISD